MLDEEKQQNNFKDTENKDNTFINPNIIEKNKNESNNLKDNLFKRKIS
jgi:hypothetical protein